MDIGFWKDILISICSAIVAIAAIVGLFTWRKELTGKVKFDLARSIMLLALKLEDNFKDARYPVTFSTESFDRKRSEEESKEEAALLDQWYIKRIRLKPLIENLQKLQELGYEAEVVFNEEISSKIIESISSFRKNWAELITSIDDYFETRRDEIIKHTPYHNQEELRELNKVISSVGQDKIAEENRQAKQQLIDTLKEYTK